MKRICLLFLLTFLFPITNVKGYYCKFSEISRYKSLATNISTTYDYIEKNGKLTFSVTLVNLNEELYIVDTTNEKVYKYDGKERTISGYAPGTVVKYEVYTNNKDCSDTLLYTIRIVLPYYNPYYSDEICNGVENYIYCQKWYNNNLDYDTFVSRVTTYKESLEKEPVVVPPKVEEYTWLDAVLDVLVDYYHIILITIIVVCGTVIYINEKKSNIYR